jgi:hypothetical protein
MVDDRLDKKVRKREEQELSLFSVLATRHNGTNY